MTHRGVLLAYGNRNTGFVYIELALTDLPPSPGERGTLTLCAETHRFRWSRQAPCSLRQG
jgi:hypothetical protein